MRKAFARWFLVSVLALGVMVSAAAADVIDDWSVNGRWSYEAHDGTTFMWADAPNSWHYTSAPGSQRVWFTTTGDDGLRAQMYLQRYLPEEKFDFSGFDSISWNVMAAQTQNDQLPVDLKMRLMLYDETYNAWVMTPDVTVNYTWTTYTFSKNTALTGATGDFLDAWNAGQFNWNSFELVRFVFLEPSADYATNQDIHVYVDDFVGNAVPEPSTISAIFMGLLGLGGVIRRRMQ